MPAVKLHLFGVTKGAPIHANQMTVQLGQAGDVAQANEVGGKNREFHAALARPILSADGPRVATCFGYCGVLKLAVWTRI